MSGSAPSQLDPALQRYLQRLTADTAVDPYELACFVRDNLAVLRPGFVASGEPEDFKEVENCPAIWLRQQFKQRPVAA